MKNRTVEILAPAGSYESMVAAVNAGADAVYIGGSRFGARAYANNLDEETMVKAIDFMHLHGCRIYMTVNTLVKEKEMWDLYSYLKPYYEAGLDAVLVQDMGVLTYIRKHFPDLPVHISTQMTVTGWRSAQSLKEMGATRVVTARELSLQEIAEIRDLAIHQGAAGIAVQAHAQILGKIGDGLGSGQLLDRAIFQGNFDHDKFPPFLVIDELMRKIPKGRRGKIG